MASSPLSAPSTVSMPICIRANLTRPRMLFWSSTTRTLVDLISAMTDSLIETGRAVRARRAERGQHTVRDTIERQDLVGGADCGRDLRHAENHRRLLVLGDGECSGLVHGEQALGAVAAHAGQDHADAVRTGLARCGVEHHVDRGLVA